MTKSPQQQREILALLASGLTFKQIAQRVHLADSTIKWHVTQLHKRYNAVNTPHLVALAIFDGDLSPQMLQPPSK